MKKAASSFVVWLNPDAVKAAEAIRGVMPRPARLRPTQHIPNNDVVLYALSLAAVAVASDEIMTDIDRISGGAVKLRSEEPAAAVSSVPELGKLDKKRIAKAKGVRVLKKAAAIAKADKFGNRKKAAKKAPVKKAVKAVKKTVKKAAMPKV